MIGGAHRARLYAPGMKSFVALAAFALGLGCGPVPVPEHERDDVDPRAIGRAGPADVEAPGLLDEPPVDEPPVDEPPVDEPPGDDPPVEDPEEPPPVDVPPPDDENGGGEPIDETAAAPTCSIVQRPERPATCPFGGNELVVWGQEGWNVLADAVAADLSPCTDVFI